MTLDAGVAAKEFYAGLSKEALAEEAAIWGFSLVQTSRFLRKAAELGVPMNRLRVEPCLVTAEAESVGPNMDTLYGQAWLDLAQEPWVLSVPDMGERYYCFQLMDAYLETFGYVGKRATGKGARAFAFTGPNWKGTLPEGVTQIEAPTDLVFLNPRTHIIGHDDLDNARQVQSQYSLAPLSTYPNGQSYAIEQFNVMDVLAPVYVQNDGIAYFDELCAMLKRCPPSSVNHRARLKELAAVGIAPGAVPSGDRENRSILEAALPRAVERIRAMNFCFTEENGWLTNKILPDYGIDDPMIRAAVNYEGPGMHVVKEAISYNTIRDAEGQPLTGAERYIMEFPAGMLPPVNEFWSLGMYTKESFNLVRNSLDRYAINKFTPGIRYGEDGSLTLYLQHDRPTDEDAAANWLPAPKEGFMLFMRNYGPKKAMQDGTYVFPLPRRV